MTSGFFITKFGKKAPASIVQRKWMYVNPQKKKNIYSDTRKKWDPHALLPLDKLVKWFCTKNGPKDAENGTLVAEWEAIGHVYIIGRGSAGQTIKYAQVRGRKLDYRIEIGTANMLLDN